MDAIELNNGIMMPMTGMGTWPLKGLGFSFLIRQAVNLGYGSFDVASAYGNELWFGLGMKICGKPRGEIFISTKLSNSAQRNGDIRGSLHKSMKKLGIKYLDLYLMHWPLPDFYLSSWKKMEELYKDGLIRAIGVCNFHQHHLELLLEIAEIVPTINQIELHPLLSQTKLVAFCKNKGIQVQAYSPLARMHSKIINNTTLKVLAEKYEKSIPQIILRWIYQKNIVSVPKSSSKARIRENLNIFNFSLTCEDMFSIDKENLNFRVRYDPDTCDYNNL